MARMGDVVENQTPRAVSLFASNDTYVNYIQKHFSSSDKRKPETGTLHQ